MPQTGGTKEQTHDIPQIILETIRKRERVKERSMFALVGWAARRVCLPFLLSTAD